MEMKTRKSEWFGDKVMYSITMKSLPARPMETLVGPALTMTVTITKNVALMLIAVGEGQARVVV